MPSPTNLLQAELQRDGQVHGDGVAVQRSGLVAPLPKSFHGGLMQYRRAVENFHGGDFAGGVDQRVDFHVAADALLFGVGRVHRRDGLQQPGIFDIAAHRDCGDWG